MKNLLLAIQFLTIVPLKIKSVEEENLSASLIYFPLVGVLLGVFLAGISNILVILHFQEIISNILLVISLAVLTGGINLDGLADTYDAILSGRDKEDMLRMMRDPHIGVMGLLSVISVFLLKISFLTSLNITAKPAALVLSCLLSRWALVLLMFFFPYARVEGKAKIFMQNINLKIVIPATLVTLCFSLIIMRLDGVYLILIAALSGYLICNSVKRRIGGITGDTLGAVSELIEVIVLLSICLFERMI